MPTIVRHKTRNATPTTTPLHSHTSSKALRMYMRALVGFVLAVLWVGMFFSILVVSKHQYVVDPHQREPLPTHHPHSQPSPSSHHNYNGQSSPIVVDVAYLYVNGSAKGFAESVLQHADPSKVPFGQLVEGKGIVIGGGATVDPTGRMAGAVSHNHPRFRDWGELYYSLSTIHSRFPTCPSGVDNTTPLPTTPGATATCMGNVYLVVASPAHIPSYCRTNNIHMPSTTPSSPPPPLPPHHRPNSCHVCFYPQNGNTAKHGRNIGGTRSHFYSNCLEVLLRYHRPLDGLSLPTFNSNALETSLHDLLHDTHRDVGSNNNNISDDGGGDRSRLLMVMNDDMLLGTKGVEECLLATTTNTPPTPPPTITSDGRTTTRKRPGVFNPMRGRYNSNGALIPTHTTTSSLSSPVTTFMWYVERTHLLRDGCLRAALSISMGSNSSEDGEGVSPPAPTTLLLLPPMHRIIEVCTVSTTTTRPPLRTSTTPGGSHTLYDNDDGVSAGRMLAAGVDVDEGGSDAASIHQMASFTIRTVIRLHDTLLLNRAPMPHSHFHFHSFAHTPKVMDRCVLKYYFPPSEGIHTPPPPMGGAPPRHRRRGAPCDHTPQLPPLPYWWVQEVVRTTRSNRFRSGGDLWVPLAYPYLAELYYHRLLTTPHPHQLPLPILPRHRLQVIELYVPPSLSSPSTLPLPPKRCYTDSYYYGAMTTTESPSVIDEHLFNKPMPATSTSDAGPTSVNPSREEVLPLSQLMKASLPPPATTPTSAPLFTTINDDLPYLPQEDGSLARVREALGRLLAAIASPSV